VDYCGMDLHGRTCTAKVISEEGELVEETTIPSTEKAVRRWASGHEPMRVCIEASGISPWVSRVLGECGHEVVVANPRRVRLIAESSLKTDHVDAMILAQLGRMNPAFLCPVTHRSEETQMERAELRVRDALVQARASFIHTVRGLLRSFGVRLPRCNAECFAKRCAAVAMKERLQALVTPLIEAIAQLDERIAAMDQRVLELGEVHPVAERFQDIPGVGPLVALAYITTIEEPHRFRRSRDVGPYLGMRPRLRASGGQEHRGRITKEGDHQMRRLLVQAAHGMLRSRRECALKRWAEGLIPRIGKRKAVVALARKLAILMHHLWVSGESFEAFAQAKRHAA
jgi:transposase